MVLLGATSIVGYNIILRRHPDLTGYVTSRSRRPVIAGWPRVALHDEAELAAFCDALPHRSTVIYCDAVCDVSKCENDPDWAREINVGNLERTLRHLPHNTRLVYVSSDHVFGNDGIYDESSPTCPVSRYGAIRAEAEQLALSWPGCLVIRAGLPIGPSLDGKSGHLDWLRYRLGRGLPVTIIKDEARSAVPSPLLADRIIRLALSNITGMRHVAAAKVVSRVELAHALKDHFDFPGKLHFSTRAQQPAPHLGRIHLATQFNDELALPLESPMDLLETSSDLLTINIPPAQQLKDEQSVPDQYARFF